MSTDYTDDADDELLTRAQVATMLGVTTKQVIEWRDNYGLPCSTKKFDSRRSYPESEVREWATELGKRTYPIHEKKKKDPYPGAKLFDDEPTPEDQQYHPTFNLKCVECGKGLLAHNTDGRKYKCPGGCKVRSVKCRECGKRRLLYRNLRLEEDGSYWCGCNLMR